MRPKHIHPNLSTQPRPPFPRRAAMQGLTLAIVLVIGYKFAVWVGHLEAGTPTSSRPAGVEGFLPISAMISFRHFLWSGEFSMIHPAGLVIFSLVCLTGLMLKKAFCSWLCPIGTLSEYLARLAHALFARRVTLPAWLDYALMSMKYLILFFFVHAIFVRMSPADVAAFIDTPYNKVADIKMLYFFSHISHFALYVIMGLLLLSFLLPYFWCRYLCPYGALLGILSIFSPVKVRRSRPDCIQCGQCADVCPSFIRVDKKTSVSSPECTGCMECVVHCPEKDALAIKTPGIRSRTLKPAAFALLVAMFFYGGIGLAKVMERWESTVSQAELMSRIQEGLDGPEYEHFGR